MKCVKCGANYGSELVKCPYCGEINASAVQYSNVLQGYNEEYKRVEEALTEKGSSKALKVITICMICIYIFVLAITFFVVKSVNNVVTGESSIVKNSSAQKANEALLEEYMSKGEYHRALILVDQTDLSMYADELTGFEYYREYWDSLDAIFPYVNIYNEIRFCLSDMEEGNDFRSFTDNQAISFEIFYNTPDTELKAKLQDELEQYLKNFYRFTDEEVEALRNCKSYLDFRMEGSKDYEAITKERMVEYFEK